MSVANWLGRQSSLAIYAGITCIGLVIQASTLSLGQLIVGRGFRGIGVGDVHSIVTVWQPETTHPKSSEKNLIDSGTFAASGIALVAWVNFGLSYDQSSSRCWSFSLAMPLVSAIPLLFTSFLFPKSPRWLVQRCDLDTAKRAFAIIKETDPKDNELMAAVEQVRLSVGSASEEKARFLKLLRNWHQCNAYRVALAFFVKFAA